MILGCNAICINYVEVKYLVEKEINDKLKAFSSS